MKKARVRVVVFDIVTLIVAITLIGAIGYASYMWIIPPGEVVINNHTYRKRDDHISFHDKDMSVVAYKRLRLVDDKVVTEYDVLCTLREKASGKDKAFFLQTKGKTKFVGTSSGSIYEDNGKSTLAVVVPYKILAEGRVQFSFQVVPTGNDDIFSDLFDVSTAGAEIDGDEVSFSGRERRSASHFNSASHGIISLFGAVLLVLLSWFLYKGWDLLHDHIALKG